MPGKSSGQAPTPAMSEHHRHGFTDCPESVSGHDTAGTLDGSCSWCGRQIDPRPRPLRLPRGHVTELEDAYRTHYDPDWSA